MPFQSKAQQRKFGAMVGRGEISKAKFKEWAGKSASSLPERKKKTKRGKPPLPK